MSDLAELTGYIATLDAAIASLQNSHEADAGSRQAVREQAMLQDAARSRFLRANLDHIYRSLTCDLSEHLTIAELCARAAEIYPALLPSAEQMAAERRLPLDHRVGRELSPASFVSVVLGNVQFGRHLLASMRRPSKLASGQLAEYSKRGSLDLGSVTIERRGAAAIITLENGDCLNAEDLELLTALELAVDVALLSPSTRVGVIRGGVMSHPKYRGRRIFCAGINLRKLAGGQIPIVDYLISREAGLMEKIRRGLWLEGQDHGSEMFRYEKPWIGVVEGFAIGGGFQLLLNVDKVIAASDAYFSLPASNEGILPGSANFRLARTVGSRLARRMILFGERIDAAGEHGKLICDEVVDPNSIDAAVDAAVAELSGDAAVANRHMMNISDEPEEQLLRYLSEFCQVQARRSLSEDVMGKVKSW